MCCETKFQRPLHVENTDEILLPQREADRYTLTCGTYFKTESSPRISALRFVLGLAQG